MTIVRRVNPEARAHGTRSRYCAGCRCASCREASTRYARERDHGVAHPRPSLPLAERFWPKVDRSAGPDDCWPWTGSRNRRGYGQVNEGGRGRPVLAHRVALELQLGRPLGRAMFACHTCDNPPCCNPAHLFEGTHEENMADMVAKGRWSRPSRSTAP